MSFYHKIGKIPHKRHTAFRKPNGQLYYEQLFGTEGFSGMSSLLYHLHRPTQVKSVKESLDLTPKIARDVNIQAFRFDGFKVKPTQDYIDSRIPVLVNDDIQLILAAPTHSMKDYFYKNADCDELIFVHKGKGKLRTHLGNLDFGYGDYLVIPRGTIYKLEFTTTDNRFFIVQSQQPIYTPKRYRNEFGQLLESSPFCERDLRRPYELETYDEKGDFLIRIHKQGKLFDLTYAYHPFDVVGYDGFNHPYAFNIQDFEPITGRIHQPPPVHQTFETSACVVCSFCPRLFDYHPESIPAPYSHSNIDSDEVLYYVDGKFMSRPEVEVGNITLHPMGIPHGPQPGAAEASIGKTSTEELAVMVDTFRPLKVTEAGLGLTDGQYFKSWLEKTDK